MYVESRFHLSPSVRDRLASQPVPWGFGPLSEAVFYRTYSRLTDSGRQEAWHDTVIRVVEGAMSVRKDWLVNVLGKRWDEQQAQAFADELAAAIFEMRLLPPGRGLWAMGTDYVYERGVHALMNCGYVDVQRSLADSAAWLMDSLMCGVGVGFSTQRARLSFSPPRGEPSRYVVPDTKEGWAESVRLLIASYEHGTSSVTFDYSLVRPRGAPIRGFGGVSAGAAPLEKLHDRLRTFLELAAHPGGWNQTRTIADVMNSIGACVVAGNVRRSAELAIGAPDDDTFLNLKNYERFPQRADIGWMSNNSVALEERDHFSALPGLAERIRDNGEPGVLNMMNVRKYGRVGEKMPDDATGFNPCSEIALEDRELCCLVEVFPTRCRGDEEIWRTMELATFYASTVALLRSHQYTTNDVMARNRRIGVSVSGVADWLDATSASRVFDVLNRGYDRVRAANRALARSAGVSESVRVTTVKPSGTVSLLAGVSSGMHFPVAPHVLRRVRIADGSPVADLLAEAGVPNEQDAYSDNTRVFEFPLEYGRGKTRSVSDVSVFEQAAIVAMLQRAWTDNAVSNTLTIAPHEMRHVESVLAMFAPQSKSLSFLPDVDGGAYEQMPLEAIDAGEHERRAAALRFVDWSALSGSDGDGSDERFCTTDACEVVPPVDLVALSTKQLVDIL